MLALVAVLQGSTVRGAAVLRGDIAAGAVVQNSAEHASSVLVVPLAKSHHHDASDITHDPSLASKEVHVPWMMLPLTVVLVTSFIMFIYGPRGPRVVASVIVYLLSLASMKLSVKWVFATHAYPFAKFVSALHFIAGGLVTFTILQRRGVPIPRPTFQEFSLMICPIAMAVVLSIGANNMALVFSTAAFTEIIGATNCLITIALVMMMGMPIDKWLILPACVVAFGCALGTVGELNFSLLGMLLCLMSNVFRSLKVTLQQKLMTGASQDKFDPTALLFWISLPSSFVMLVGSLSTEGLSPYAALGGRGPSELHGLLFAIIVSCVNATILNLAQLYVTKDLGAVGGQLVAQAKMVLTVLGGIVLFGESFSQLEVIGFALALVGVFAFTRMDQAFKEKQKGALNPQESGVANYQAPEASVAAKVK